MSHVTLMTRHLVALLRDSLLTVSSDEDYPQLNGVLLDCDHAQVQIESTPDNKDEVALIDTMESNVLVASSMDGVTMASQGHAPCEGWLHKAVLLAADDVDTVVRAFTGKGKRAPKNSIHRTKVAVSGDGVTFTEVHESVLDGIQITVQQQDLSEYPRGIHHTLCPDPVSQVLDKDTKTAVPATLGSAFHPVGWGIAVKVSKDRQEPPVIYRYHQRKLHVVEVGTMWRAVFQPVRLFDEEAYAAPRVPVFEPRLPRKDADDPDAQNVMNV